MILSQNVRHIVLAVVMCRWNPTGLQFFVSEPESERKSSSLRHNANSDLKRSHTDNIPAFSIAIKDTFSTLQTQSSQYLFIKLSVLSRADIEAIGATVILLFRKCYDIQHVQHFEHVV